MHCSTMTKESSSSDGHHKRVQRPSFYPRGLAYALAALKLFCGCALVVTGCLAMYQNASYSRTAAGVWGGLIVVISAVLAFFSARTRRAERAYVLAFFFGCVAAVLTDVLVIIYAATGLATDSGFPGGFVRDETSGELIPVSQVNIPAREKAMLVNLVLIILGVLDVLFSLPGIIITLREVCGCYGPEMLMAAAAAAASGDGSAGSREWLMGSWQQQQSNQIYYSNTSGVPFAKVPAGYHHHYLNPAAATPPFVFLPPEPLRHSGNSGNNGGAFFAPLEVYASPQFYYASPPPYPSPASNMSHPSMAHLLPAASPWEFDIYHQPPPTAYYGTAPPPPPPVSSSSGRRRRRSRSQSAAAPSNRSSGRQRRPHQQQHHRRRNGPTDSDLDKTYTGLDRELAEEFIEQTMEPESVAAAGSTSRGSRSAALTAASDRADEKQHRRQQHVSGTESEEW